jgi:GH15 family glucan-1,4-alpha-glucosidase
MKVNQSSIDRLSVVSRKVLAENQSQYGSYIASPTFHEYRFAWLRDGAFCALAAYLEGDIQGASRFNSWVVSTISRHRSIFETAISKIEQEGTLDPKDAPPTRFQMDGSIEVDAHSVWPNYQIDGYGTWLAVALQTNLEVTNENARSIRLVADFLCTAWSLPCFDCWEEDKDNLHGSSLLAVAGGLIAAAKLLNDAHYFEVATEIKVRIERDFVSNGHFIKNQFSQLVDGSLAWAFLPHQAYNFDDPLVIRTIEQIKKDLQSKNGGVKRYLGDTYYGGGDWILLEALVSFHETKLGNKEAFLKSVEWIRSTANENFMLPEQITTNSQNKEMIQPWIDKWGLPADPLLWSHAMYLILMNEGRKQGWV